MLAVDDYLQKHELIEANINTNGNLILLLKYAIFILAEWLKTIKHQSLEYIKSKGEKYEVLLQKLDEVEKNFEQLLELCRERRAALNKAKEYFQFVQNFEEEMNWLTEKHDFCIMMLQKRDISNVSHFTRLYKVNQILKIKK